MKTLQIVAMAIALFTLFPSCQPTSAQMKELTNKDKRIEIMNAIAHDSTISQEMINMMMNSKNGMLRMHQHQMMLMNNHDSMMGWLKNNPYMMHNTMSAMMETANGDTSMMYGMIRTMMENRQMKGMMQNMNGNNGNRMMHNMRGMKY